MGVEVVHHIYSCLIKCGMEHLEIKFSPNKSWISKLFTIFTIVLLVRPQNIPFLHWSTRRWSFHRTIIRVVIFIKKGLYFYFGKREEVNITFCKKD